MRWLVCWVAMLAFGSLSASSAPVEFAPINEHLRLAVEPSDDGLKRYFQSLALSADGAYVALGRLDGKVDIWSVADGGNTAALQLAYREDRRAFVALLGNPCVAIMGVSARFDVRAPSPGAAARPLELWSCESGERIGEIRIGDDHTLNDLLDLVAVPGCGLAVASYSDRVVVVDVASRATAPRLSRLFDEAREAALRSYPPSAPKEGTPGTVLKLAASPSAGSCLVYVAVHAYDARADALLPAKIYEVDLRRGQSRLARALKYEAIAIDSPWSVYTAFALSPTGRYAALSIRRPIDFARPTFGPRGVADLLLVDLKSGAAVKSLDMRHLVTGIVNLAFVSDDVLFFSTTAMGESTNAMLFDQQSGRLHTVCSSNFGERDPLKGNPRAVAVNAKLNLIAVSLRDEVRVFRYRLNPKDRWVNMRKSCVPT